jgi:hypothetical protein
MTFVKNTITFETAEGEQEEERVYTDNGEGTELNIDADGDVLVHETFENEEGEEMEFLSLYVPRHRLVNLDADIIDA